MRRIIVLALVALLPPGACAPQDSSTRGSNVPASTEKFQRGVTTITELQMKLGKPLSIVTNSDDITSLVYARTATTISSRTSAGRAVTFQFGPGGILRDRYQRYSHQFLTWTLPLISTSCATRW